MSLSDDISDLVERSVNPTRHASGWHIVTDPIHGRFELSPLEATLSSMPMMQRLKRIHQMGLAFHVYPGAVHTRFEHSLGTAFVAAEILRVFGEKLPHLVDQKTRTEIRLAALLHDIGHAPFSHLGERLWYRKIEFRNMAKGDRFRGTKPHEIVSDLVVRSTPFQHVLKELIRRYNMPAVDTEQIGDYIIGSANFDSNASWVGRLINGSQVPDADRLDYVARDSYFSGLETSVDVRNVVRSFAAAATLDGPSLVFDPDIVSVLERMLFFRLAKGRVENRGVLVPECLDAEAFIHEARDFDINVHIE